MSGAGEPTRSGNEDAYHASDKENQGSLTPSSQEDSSSDVDYSYVEMMRGLTSANASGRPETSAAVVAGAGNQSLESGHSTPPRCSSPHLLKYLLSPSKANIPSALVMSELQGFGGVRSEGASVTEARGGGVPEPAPIPEAKRMTEALPKRMTSTEAEKESVPGSSGILEKLLASPLQARIPSSLAASESQGRSEGASGTEARGGVPEPAPIPEAKRMTEALSKRTSTEAEKESVPGSSGILEKLLASPIQARIPSSLAESESQGRSEAAGLQDTEARGAGVPEASPTSEAVHPAVQDTEAGGGDVSEAVSKTVKGTEVEEESISEAAKSTESKQGAAAEGDSVPEAMQVSEGSVPESVQGSVSEVEMSDATGSNVPEEVPTSGVAAEGMQTSEPDKDYENPPGTVPSSSNVHKMKNRFGSINLGTPERQSDTPKHQRDTTKHQSGTPKRQSERLKKKEMVKSVDSPSSKVSKSSRSRTERTSIEDRMSTRSRRLETVSNAPEVEMHDATGSNVPELVPDATTSKDSAPTKGEVSAEEMQTSDSDKDFKKPYSSKDKSQSSKKERIKSSRSQTSERTSADERMATRGRRLETVRNVPEAVPGSVSEVEMSDATGSNVPEEVPSKSEVSAEEMQTSDSDKDFKKPASIAPSSSKDQPSGRKKERKSSRSQTSERTSSDERRSTRARTRLESASSNSEKDSSGDETRGKRASRRNSKK